MKITMQFALKKSKGQPSLFMIQKKEEKDEREREKTMAGYYNLDQDFLFLIGRSEDEINFIFSQILRVSSWHRPL